MKKLLYILIAFPYVALCQAPKDTVRLDSTHMEKIRKMPMDTVNNRMPVAPLQSDTVYHDRIRDDADPKRMQDSLRRKN